MRRTAAVSLLVLALAVAGCTSSSATKRTVTVVNTVTGAPPASVPKVSSSVILVSPSSTTPKTTSSAPKPTPTTTSSSAPPPIVKVDPTKADCAEILDAADIKKAIGATVADKNNRVRLGAAAHGVSGAIRCLYGSTDGGKTAPVRIRLTLYSSAAAAKAQVAVDLAAAEDGGAAVTNTTVGGYPASVQLLAGGVLEMQYDTWTMALAVSDKQAANAKLTSGLPVLAAQALDRILKG